MRKWIALLAAMVLALPAAVFAETPAEEEERAVQSLPAKQWALHDLSALAVTRVSQVTGEDSPNRTLTRFGVWGTDLGSFTVLDGITYLFGGDTFSSEDGDGWRSNVLFLCDDDDPADGLTITDAVCDKRGQAREMLLSLKQDHTEMTVIPTNLFSYGGKLYCMYMSVSHWGEAGRWECRYSGLAVSGDRGQKWRKLQDVRWPGDSGFVQMANALIGDTMYFRGIPAGRFGGVSLMKVSADSLEDFSAYRYFTGTDDAGSPVWASGSAGIAGAARIIRRPVGEISVLYNEYLGNFLITYLNEGKHAIVMRESTMPWGPFGDEWTLATAKDYPSLYGAFMCPDCVADKGKSVYFTMSQYFPVYNIQWMRMDLP